MSISEILVLVFCVLQIFMILLLHLFIRDILDPNESTPLESDNKEYKYKTKKEYYVDKNGKISVKEVKEN